MTCSCGGRGRGVYDTDHDPWRGHDIEGVQATIVSCHEGISHSLADEVISVLESVGDIVRLDGELYVRPGTDPKVRPPIPMPPPPAPPPSAAP